MTESRNLDSRHADEIARNRYIRRSMASVLMALGSFALLVGVVFAYAQVSGRAGEDLVWLPEYGGLAIAIVSLAVLMSGIILFSSARWVR